MNKYGALERYNLEYNIRVEPLGLHRRRNSRLHYKKYRKCDILYDIKNLEVSLVSNFLTANSLMRQTLVSN